MEDTRPPVSAGTLERARLAFRNTVPARGIGAHLRRLAGHSLEFRDYRDYQMGDDIRLVDWRASARIGGENDRVLRVFEAEQHMTLMILVDARAAMRLPVDAEKLLFALWTLRALAQVAGANGDNVVMATVFSPQGPKIVRTRGRAAGQAAGLFAEQVWGTQPGPLSLVPVADFAGIERHLAPASAVAFLSDLLFDDPDDRVLRFMRKAQKSWRQVVVQRLDTLDQELAALRASSRFRAEATEGREFGPGVYQTNDAFEEEVRHLAAQLAQRRQREWRGPGLTVERPVAWPVTPGRDALQRLFANSFERSDLFRSIVARRGAG